MDRVDDLTFRDGFAAADDTAVCGILLNKFVSLFDGEVCGIEDALAGSYPVFLLLCAKFLFHHLADVLADSRAGCKSGRLNTCAVDEVRSILYFAQDELVVILVGTKACKGCDDLGLQRM